MLNTAIWCNIICFNNVWLEGVSPEQKFVFKNLKKATSFYVDLKPQEKKSKKNAKLLEKIFFNKLPLKLKKVF